MACVGDSATSMGITDSADETSSAVYAICAGCNEGSGSGSEEVVSPPPHAIKKTVRNELARASQTCLSHWGTKS